MHLGCLTVASLCVLLVAPDAFASPQDDSDNRDMVRGLRNWEVERAQGDGLELGEGSLQARGYKTYKEMKDLKKYKKMDKNLKRKHPKKPKKPKKAKKAKKPKHRDSSDAGNPKGSKVPEGPKGPVAPESPKGPVAPESPKEPVAPESPKSPSQLNPSPDETNAADE